MFKINEAEILASKDRLEEVGEFCEESLMNFSTFFFSYLNKSDYLNTDYLKTVASALEPTYNGGTTRLIINIPSRLGKTQLAIYYIALGIALNPKARFLYLSYSDSLTHDVSSGVKDIIESPIYQAVWGVELRVDAKAKKKWYTKQGGGMLAVSMSGQVTGFGAGIVSDDDYNNLSRVQKYNIDEIEEAKYSKSFDEKINKIQPDIDSFVEYEFGGAIFIDDPIKPDDARYSPTIRDKVNSKYISTIRNRKNNPNTPIILIMQRLHPNDLAGFLINGNAGDNWDQIKIPILNENNESIAPHIFPTSELEAWKKADNEDFETQGMQNPVAAKGLSFPFNELNYYENLPDREISNVYSFSDYADEGDDFYSMPIAYIYKNPLQIFIPDAVFSDNGNKYTLNKSFEKIKAHNISKAVIETNAAGIFGYNEIKKNVTENNVPCQILGIKAKGNKEARIAEQRDFIKEFFHFQNPKSQTFGGEYYKFFNNVIEHKRAGGNKHDDAPDSLAGLSALIRTYLK